MKQANRWVCLLAALCAMALLLPLLPSAMAATYPYDTVSMDDVNLRKKANTTSIVLKKIKAGDTVTILGVTKDFYQVKFDGKTGYAKKAFIDGTDPSPDPTVDPSLTQQAPPAIYEYPYDTTVISQVKLRKKAQTDGEVIQTLPAGTMVTVYDRMGNGFAKVKYNGKTGYVAETHINLADIPVAEVKLTPTPDPEAAKYAELKLGDKGDAVTALQSALAELGYMEESEVDGKFGSKTESALKTFQKRNGFTQNGIATSALQLKMYESTPKDYRGYRQYVKTVAPVAGALIRKDSKGAAVSKLQTRLKELGYYTGDITGTCNADTVDAIKLFEGRHGLVADGEMDSADQQILFGATAMDASVQITPTPAPTLAPPTKTLRRGDKDEEVKSLQQRLKDLGYYTGSVTGTYNAATETAVKDFQKKSQITADGVCGPVTRTVLYGVNAIYAVPTAVPVASVAPGTDATYPPITQDNVIIIRAGSMGEIVLRLQKRLQELGYYTSRLDGVYLTDDMEAVRAFQKASGLKVDGKAGYDTQTALYSENAIRGNASAGATDAATVSSLRYGSEGTAVTTLQNQLITLGYLAGSADGKFGRNTKSALMAFQKANGLKADGIAGKETQAMLSGGNAKSNTVSTTTTLRVGAVSDAVKDLQNRLITLGYLTGKADGNFGVQTSMAVIAFQKANGLTADGIAGAKTLAKLNATNATTATGQTTTTTTLGAPSAAGVTASQVQYANWYSEIRAKARKYPNATVYDFTTGISWQVNMFSLGAHADSEPLTAADTANMNRAFGGKTTWTPKAVWVILSDGSVYMASTHNTPHDTWHIRNNNFDGHLCIHFPRTQAQVEKIGPYATSHQKAIDQGWAATLRRAQ